MFVSTETKAWLEQKFREWRDTQTRRGGTVKGFAAHVGVSLSTMNNWLNRGQTPDVESVGKLAPLGMEIYDLMSLPRPDPLLQVVVQYWGRLPDDIKQEIVEAVERAEARGVAGSGDRGMASPKHRGAKSN